MADLTDWLAATFFVSPDDVQTHEDVAAAQNAELTSQYNAGAISLPTYESLSSEVTDAGNYLSDYQAANSGVSGFFKNLPSWVWLVLVVAALGLFFWVGGLSRIRGIFKKGKK